MPTTRRVTEDVLDQMIELSKSGSSITEIAKHLGFSRRTIWLHLDRVGHNTRATGIFPRHAPRASSSILDESFDDEF